MRHEYGPCKLGCGVREGVLPADPDLASDPDAVRISAADKDRGGFCAPAAADVTGAAGAEQVAVRPLANAAACAALMLPLLPTWRGSQPQRQPKRDERGMPRTS